MTRPGCQIPAFTYLFTCTTDLFDADAPPF
jgi:hypothetical protein